MDASAPPGAIHAIGVGGFLVGLLDGADAVVFSYVAQGVAPETLFQYIAGGLLGRESFTGGWRTAALGIACHFAIAFSAAAVYYATSLLWSALYRKPWICGPIYGIAVYLFMQHVVLPLSAVARRPHVPHLVTANLLFSHIFFVGLPLALTAWHSARQRVVAGSPTVEI
jgi:hypothetical protein